MAALSVSNCSLSDVGYVGGAENGDQLLLVVVNVALHHVHAGAEEALEGGYVEDYRKSEQGSY